ncbi:unnamed protein product [Gongylonema pulchrum]|uniref:BRCT domain-containing protein n=1 Tax=Gongylonema pulchrum TaxID=637853 RepID=A0A183DB81_9BILA|nr:unnamed protein product [Gongylonema pulchrum]
MERKFVRTTITRMEKFKGRALFICGFIDQRWHNSSLLAIAAELFPQCYVSCNEGQGTKKGTMNALQLIESAHAMLFYVNEFTLKDAQCLLVLQHASYKDTPTILLRPPRTKLIIENTPSTDQIQRYTDNTYIISFNEVIYLD